MINCFQLCVNFAFNFKLRRHIMDMDPAAPAFQRLANNVFAFTAFKSTEPYLEQYAALDVPEAGAYTRPLFSSTCAVLVTPPRVPLSHRLGVKHAPSVSHKPYFC